jgi:16S rRNA processing protein RimM
MRGSHASAPVDPQERKTGSPLPGEPVFLVVGHFQKAHGVQGEITMEVLTDFPERLKPNTWIYVGESYKKLQIATARWKAKFLLLSFLEFTDCDQVNVLRNELAYVRTDTLPSLPAGQYYHHQLLGLSVQDEAGHRLGSLVEILETGANDVYVVRPEGKEDILLPAIESVILEIDLDRNCMVVRLPEWE